eukprot:g3547.t1
MNEYRLSAILEGHSSDVRCIAVASTGRIITASRDMTMRLWDQAPGVANGAYICHKTVHHASWLTSLCVLPPIPNAANELLRIAGGIVAGCKDGQIQVHDSDGNVLFVLPGHSGQVSSVSTTSAGLLVSGSWDGSMRVWDLSIEKCIFQQDGFENSVAVLGLPNGSIATGSAGLQTGPSQVGEMKIRIYAPSGEGDGKEWTCTRTLTDHKHRISELSLIDGLGFCSTSNDGTTRIRTYNGDVINMLGHEGGEWSQSACAVPSTKDIVVAYDDGVLKVWRDSDVVQMLIHPREIWCVRGLPNGDLVTGCPQGRTTIWTRDPSRTAKPEIISTYNRKTFETRSLIAAKTGRQLDVSTLPSFEQRKAHQGSLDGEIRQFNKGGKAFTFRWDLASGAWVELGEATGNAKQEVDGVYYDRVLPVEIDLPGQGLSNVKLGFNDGDNPYNVALQFCAKHKIDAQQVGQIVDFINQNRSSAAPTIGSTPINNEMTMSQFGEGHTFDMAQLMGGGAGGTGGAVGRRVGEKTASAIASGGQKSARGESTSAVQWPSPDFPQRLGLTFNSNKKGLAGMSKALTKIGSQIFDESQQRQLLQLLDTIQETSRYHASSVTDGQVRLVVEALASSSGGTCPVAEQFPFVDLLRGAMLHNEFASRLGGIHDLDSLLMIMMENAFADGVKVAHTYLFLQFVSNLLVSGATTEHALLFCDAARADLLSGNRFTKHAHKHVINGFATLLLNLSVHVFHGRQFGVNDAAARFRRDVCTLSTDLMSTAIERAEEAAAAQGKTTPMVTIAKRCFIAVGTARIGSDIDVDDGTLKSLCERLINLDSEYASFVKMVEDCVRMHHGTRK